MPGEMPFCKKQAEREHASSSRTDRMPVCKSEHVCQVGLVKCLFAKASWKRTCFVKHAWWNAVLQDKLKENVLCQVCLVKCRFANTSSCQVCLVKCRFAKTSSKRTCLEPQKGLSWSRKCQGQNADQGGSWTPPSPNCHLVHDPQMKSHFYHLFDPIFAHLRRSAPPDPLNSLRSQK